jgi:NADH:ubiquinone oxidoreductase subunit 2 (subunit N)
LFAYSLGYSLSTLSVTILLAMIDKGLKGYLNLSSLRGMTSVEALFMGIHILSLIGLPPLALFIVKAHAFASG